MPLLAKLRMIRQSLHLSAFHVLSYYRTPFIAASAVVTSVECSTVVFAFGMLGCVLFMSQWSFKGQNLLLSPLLLFVRILSIWNVAGGQGASPHL